jgi:hypothetical protein
VELSFRDHTPQAGPLNAIASIGNNGAVLHGDDALGAAGGEIGKMLAKDSL